MKKRLFPVVLCAVFSLVLLAWSGCSRITTDSVIYGIPYISAKNYFFINDQPAPADPRITSQEQFDQLFGTAAFMGKGGETTPIDFNRQFVIAVVLPETSVQTAISAKMLIATKQKITLLYQVDKGARLGYTMRPIMLLVVDKKYDTGKVVVRKS